MSERGVRSQPGETLEEVCAHYGLPASAHALERHLVNNANATMEVWRHLAMKEPRRDDNEHGGASRPEQADRE